MKKSQEKHLKNKTLIYGGILLFIIGAGGLLFFEKSSSKIPEYMTLKSEPKQEEVEQVYVTEKTFTEVIMDIFKILPITLMIIIALPMLLIIVNVLGKR